MNNKQKILTLFAFLLFSYSISGQILQNAASDKYKNLPKGTVIYSFMSGDSVSHTKIELPDSLKRYIIEFTQSPLLATLKGTNLKSASLINSQLQRIDQQHVQFRNDLSNMSGIKSTKLKSLSISGRSNQIEKDFRKVFNGVSLTADKNLVNQIKQLDYVKRIYPDNMVDAYDDESNQVIKADSVREKYGATGKGVVIAIVDTGIDSTHQDLSHGKVIGGYDFVNDDNNPMDDHGHGTHCAGIAAANGPGLTGVAPDAKLLAVKVLNEWGSGYDSWIIAGIEYAIDPDGDPLTDDGADIISMSLGASNGDPNDAMSTAINNAFKMGVLCVVAAGNEGSLYSTIGSPGCAKEALTVGASDNNDYIAYFSSRGPALNSFDIKPNVLAPGYNIYSSLPNDQYATWSGTSMATPHVAGAAALLKQIHKDWNAQRLRSAIVHSAVDVNQDYDVWTQGNGRVDLLKAASVATSISKNSINLGLIPDSIAAYSKVDSFYVYNLTSASLNYKLSTNDELPSEIMLGISPNQFTLAPLDSQLVIFSLNADNTTLAYPSSPVEAYTGKVIIDDGIQPQNLLFSMIKSYSFTLNFDFQPAALLIFNTDDYFNYFYPTGNSFSTLLPSGKYDIIVYNSTSFIVREEVDIEKTHQLSISISEAKYKANFKGYGPDGNPLSIFDSSPERLVLKSDMYTGFCLMKITLGDGHTVPPIERLFSSFSERYRYEIAPMSYPHSNSNHSYYTIPFLINHPLTKDTTLANVPTDFIKVSFNHNQINNLFDSLYFTLQGFSSSIGGYYYLYDPFDTLTHILSSPFFLNYYVVPSPDRDFYINDLFGYGLHKYHGKIDPNVDTLVYYTPNYSCYKDSGGVYFKRGYLDQPQRINSIDGNITCDQNLSPLYKKRPVDIYINNKMLLIGKESPIFIDQNFGTPVDKIFVTYKQGSTILEKDTLLNCYSITNYENIEIPYKNNVDYSLNFESMPYLLNKRIGRSYTNFYFNIGTTTTWSDFLYSLNNFQILSDGIPANSFSANKNNQIQFELSTFLYPKVKLFMKSVSGTSWKKFYEWNYNSDSSKSSFSIQIPDTLATDYYSLKLTMIASENDSVENIFEPAFCIANNFELDSLALVDLYTSTNGKNWTNNTNWLKTNVKDWFGVHVESGKVVGINLPNNNLIGSLSASLKNLSNLTTLIINDNYLESLNDLTQIEKLINVNVSNNLLTFTDIVPNLPINSLIYSPQRKLGEIKDYDLIENTSFDLNTLFMEEESHYVWFKNSQRISGNDSSILNFPSISKSDEGSYVCFITNENVPGLTLQTYPSAISTFPMMLIDRSNLLDNLNVYSFGGSWIDFDNDDDQDLFIVNYGISNQLFQNMLSETDSVWFKEVTETAMGYDKGTTVTSTWGDINNDGFIDAFIVNQDYSEPKILFINNGNGTFRELNDTEIQSQLRYSSTANLIDFNQDGLLDLFIANTYHYLLSDNSNQMLINQGDLSFENIQIINLSWSFYNQSCSWSDFDNDSDLDVFVSSYSYDFLLKNNGDKFLEPYGESLLFSTSAYGQTNSIGDLDNDGDLDVFSGHSGWYGAFTSDPNNVLYENHNNTISISEDSLFTSDKTNYFGSSWGDYDNDGDLDLLGTSFLGVTNLWTNQLQETGIVSFKKVNYGAISEYLKGGRGCAFADYDNDGDLDIFISGSTYGNHLFENIVGSKNNWINIKCTGKYSNASAIGTKVKIKATINNKPCWQMQEISSQTGYSGQNSLNVEFGLGNATIIDSIKIYWPSGIYWDTTNVSINQFINIVEHERPNDSPQLIAFNDTIIKENVPFSKSYEVIDNLNKGIKFQIIEKPSWLDYEVKNKIITFTGTPGDYSPGSYTLILSYNDGYLDTPLIDSLNIMVENVNDPPVILGQSPLMLNSDGKLILSLDQLIIVDIDNNTEDLSLIIFDGEYYTIQNDTIVVVQNYFDDLKVKVQVSDGIDLSLPFQLSIQNNINDIPEIGSSTKYFNATEDSYFETELDIADEIHSKITVMPLSSPSWISFSNLTSNQYTSFIEDEGTALKISGTPGNSDTGLNYIMVEINDGYLSAPVIDTITIFVQQVNDAPVITGQKSLSINENGFIAIQMTDLLVEDIDNIYPDDFILNILNGTGYSVTSDTIFPFINETLSVPVQVNDGQLNSNIFNLTIDNNTSIIATSSPDFQVYPIPFNKVIYINIYDSPFPSKIEIFDLQGRKTNPVISQMNNYWKIDCNTLTQSIYLMKITSGNSTVTKKLIRDR